MRTDATRMALTIVLGVLVVLAVTLIGLAVTYPEIVRQSSLGAEFFLADLGYSGKGLAAVTGFKPLADGVLLVSSYGLVCAIVWMQSRFKDYLKAKGHVR